MGRFVKGDVVVTPFPFTDLAGAKRRPALVVATLAGDDVILCQITSVARNDAYSIPLDAGDFITGGLSRSSVIRPNRLFTADDGLILRSVGTVTPAKLSEVIEKLVGIVQG